MNERTFRRFALAGLALLCAVACNRNPYETQLPTNLKDIPTIQAQLNKLPAEDRQLVLDYLQRSNGDVLPPSMADPDAPFTARTFKEAIKLQREFKVKYAAQMARMEEMKGEREAAMEPLREALRIELVKREILTNDQWNGREATPGRALNNDPVLVVTYRLTNYASESITRVSGSADLRAVSNPGTLMPLFGCYIDHASPIAASESVEVRCGNANKHVGQPQQDFAIMPESALTLVWEPQTIHFASGKVLKAM